MLFKLQGKMRQILALARLTPFDTSTEEGRSNERHRLILLSAAASALAKVFSVATALISIPLTLHYLGAERFGLWMTISSVIAMLSFADLGIGNGLLNSVAEANGRNDTDAIQQYISSAFAILSLVALVVLLLFYAINPYVSWAEFFNVKSPLAIQEAGSAVNIFMLCFALNIPAGVVQRAQMALQMSFVANLWLISGSLLGLVTVLAVIYFKLGLPWLVGGMVGTPILVSILNGLIFFGKIRSDIRPRIRSIYRDAVHKVAYTGFLFFLLQVSGAVAFASDNLVLSRMLGAEAVTQYAIPEKLFSIIPMLLGMILMPLWPAYGEAKSRGDTVWIKKIFIRSLAISITLSILLASFFILFANKIFMFWVKDPGLSPFLLLLGLGLWKILEAWGVAVSLFLNGINVVRYQAFFAVLMAIFAIVLKIFFVQSIGVAGVVWATIIAFIILNFIPLNFVILRTLRQFDVG